MNYTGKIIVRNSEGIRVDHDWGGFNKLLCDDTTNDPNFTFGEMRYNPGGLRGPVQGHEAFHCLRGRGVLRVFCAGGIEGDPISIPLNPGSEFYVRGDVPRTIESSSDDPLFGIAFLCHVDRPCHTHAFSHRPGEGNFLHYHGVDKWVEPLRQEFVEAMYLIERPGFIATADPHNTVVKDYEIDEGSAVYHPLNTLHRQYNPETSEQANFWIHAGYYAGSGRPTAGVFEVPEFAIWRKDR